MVMNWCRCRYWTLLTALCVVWHVETAADETNAVTGGTAGNGDELVSVSVSASVLITGDSALITDNHADNRMSEMIVEDADEKCTYWWDSAAVLQWLISCVSAHDVQFSMLTSRLISVVVYTLVVCKCFSVWSISRDIICTVYNGTVILVLQVDRRGRGLHGPGWVQTPASEIVPKICIYDK